MKRNGWSFDRAAARHLGAAIGATLAAAAVGGPARGIILAEAVRRLGFAAASRAVAGLYSRKSGRTGGPARPSRRGDAPARV